METPACPDCGHPATAHDPEGWDADAPQIRCDECPNQICIWRNPR